MFHQAELAALFCGGSCLLQQAGGPGEHFAANRRKKRFALCDKLTVIDLVQTLAGSCFWGFIGAVVICDQKIVEFLGQDSFERFLLWGSPVLCGTSSDVKRVHIPKCSKQWGDIYCHFSCTKNTFWPLFGGLKWSKMDRLLDQCLHIDPTFFMESVSKNQSFFLVNKTGCSTNKPPGCLDLFCLASASSEPSAAHLLLSSTGLTHGGRDTSTNSN